MATMNINKTRKLINKTKRLMKENSGAIRDVREPEVYNPAEWEDRTPYDELYDELDSNKAANEVVTKFLKKVDIETIKKEIEYEVEDGPFSTTPEYDILFEYIEEHFKEPISDYISEKYELSEPSEPADDVEDFHGRALHAYNDLMERWEKAVKNINIEIYKILADMINKSVTRVQEIRKLMNITKRVLTEQTTPNFPMTLAGSVNKKFGTGLIEKYSQDEIISMIHKTYVDFMVTIGYDRAKSEKKASNTIGYDEDFIPDVLQYLK